MRRFKSKKSTLNNNIHIGNKRDKKIVELWILRTLISLNAHRYFINASRGFSDDSVADFLGLDKYVHNYSEEKFNEVFQILKE